MTTYVNSNEVPTNLTGKEFAYWCEAQDARQEAKEARYLTFCIGMACFGFGLLFSQLFCS